MQPQPRTKIDELKDRIGNELGSERQCAFRFDLFFSFSFRLKNIF